MFNDATVNSTGVAIEAGRIPPNSDSDILADFRDSDSDNDGLTDAFEAAGFQSDANGDGRVDGFVDSNSDGIDDSLVINRAPPVDSDNDGIADYLDRDSDQDGLPDIVESGGIDADDDGSIDGFVDDDFDGLDDATEQSPSSGIDTDGDGAQDHLDLDSDNDGTFDIVASGNVDTDRDGILDSAADSDGDGILDSVDVDFTGGLDLDNDGIDDSVDSDFVAEGDQDGDGIVDSADLDRDGDGRVDVLPFSAAQQQGVILTGLKGGAGCSLNVNADKDFGLLGLLLGSALLVMRRRKCTSRSLNQ